MTTLAQLEEAKKQLRRQRREWLDDNPGVLARIAETVGVSAPFVSDVLHEKRSSTDRVVEKALAGKGAPGFEAFNQAPVEGA